MNSLLELAAKVGAALTPERRKAIYLLLAAVGGLAVVFGLASDAQVAEIVGKIGAILDALALLLAAKHTPSPAQDPELS